MRKKILIGNLKMNLNKHYLTDYLTDLKNINACDNVIVGVSMPSVYLNLASDILSDSKIIYGAQNVHHKPSGAYTGEISCLMLKDYNSHFSLVGHSERRLLFFETDIDVNKKVISCLENNIMPIICVGENLTQKSENKTKTVIANQITLALKSVKRSDVDNIIIAYEPVWAIGTGATARVDDIEDICAYIKTLVSKLLDSKEEIAVLYGGSMNKENAESILKLKNIDGGLIGGASLNVSDFKSIIDIALLQT